MFRYDDFWSYMFGVFAVGGLLVVPAAWCLFSGLTYSQVLPGSLLGCGIFASGHTRRGGIDPARLLLFTALGLVFVFRTAAGGSTLILPGGVLGFVVMAGCGKAGIALARLTGLSTVPELATVNLPDPAVLDERAIERVADSPRPYLARLLASSRIAWKSGRLDSLSSLYRKEAEARDLDQFIDANTQHNVDVFDAIEDKEPFEKGEYLVRVSKSFLLTSHRLGILLENTPDGPIEIFPLRNIEDYKRKSGWSKCTVRLRLRDGRSVSFRKLDVAPDAKDVELVSKAAQSIS